MLRHKVFYLDQPEPNVEHSIQWKKMPVSTRVLSVIFENGDILLNTLTDTNQPEVEVVFYFFSIHSTWPDTKFCQPPALLLFLGTIKTDFGFANIWCNGGAIWK